MFDFPDVPTANQTILTPEGVQYLWTGSKWTLSVASGFDQATADGLYVSLVGDVMSGALSIAYDGAGASPTGAAAPGFAVTTAPLNPTGTPTGAVGLWSTNTAEGRAFAFMKKTAGADRIMGGFDSTDIYTDFTVGGSLYLGSDAANGYVGTSVGANLPFSIHANAGKRGEFNAAGLTVTGEVRASTIVNGIAGVNSDASMHAMKGYYFAADDTAVFGEWGIYAAGAEMHFWSSSGAFNLASLSQAGNLTLNGGVITLNPVATPGTPTLPGIYATPGSLQIFAPAVGIYFSEITTGTDWMWINDGGLVNATGMFQGINSIASVAAGGGPFLYMDQDQTIFELGGGLSAGAGGTTDSTVFRWRDFSANDLASLSNIGGFALYSPLPTQHAYFGAYTDVVNGAWSEVDLTADVAGTATFSLISQVPWGGLMSTNSTLTSSIYLFNFLSIGLDVNPAWLETQRQAYKPGGGMWEATSDIRVKKNVVDYTTGLAALKQLRPVTYQYNGTYGMQDDGKIRVGLVADEVEPIMPEMVGSLPRAANPPPVVVALNGDGKPPFVAGPAVDPQSLEQIKTLDATAISYAVINALKEISDRLDALEAAGGVVRAAATPAPAAPARPAQQPAPLPQRAAPTPPRPAPRRR